MTDRHDGGPAFPRPHGHLPDHPYYSGNSAEAGMSLRDWFAGQALEGRGYDGWGAQDIAEMAYEIADAMIAARSEAKP